MGNIHVESTSIHNINTSIVRALDTCPCSLTRDCAYGTGQPSSIPALTGETRAHILFEVDEMSSNV